MAEFSELIGKTITKVVVCNSYPVICFWADGRQYILRYDEESPCQESYIEVICGDMNNLIGSPLLNASEDYSNNIDENSGNQGSCIDVNTSWTVYKLETINGCVTIKWTIYACSHYGLAVDFGVYLVGDTSLLNELSRHQRWMLMNEGILCDSVASQSKK